MRAKKVVIDGYCIKTEKFNGAQRYATEILLELDKLVSDTRYELLIRPRYKDLIHLRNIKKVEIEAENKTLWRIKTFLYLVKNNALYVHFENGITLWKKSIITLHDIYAFYSVCNNSWIYHIKMKSKAIIDAIVAEHIVTVSEFSKQTMLAKLPIKQEKISVIYNGWQHLKKLESDESILKKINVVPKSFYFFLGRLVNTGFISDSEIKALYQNCKAFLFPSLMEGFGIPPMEALYNGAPIIISNTSSLPEVYEDCAHYIDPMKYDYCLDDLLKGSVASSKKILDKYSWEKSAKKWHELIEGYMV